MGLLWRKGEMMESNKNGATAPIRAWWLDHGKLAMAADRGQRREPDGNQQCHLFVGLTLISMEEGRSKGPDEEKL
jgi:hypothetical protein